MLPKTHFRTIPFESLAQEEQNVGGVLFVNRDGENLLVEMPRLSAFGGMVRFLSISLGLTLSSIFAAMFIDFFLMDETLSHTVKHSSMFALAATSIAFADLLHKFQLVD